MRHALALASAAEDSAEVPVGAVVVHNDMLVGEGFNRTISERDPSGHAEIIALRAAGQTLHNYRMPGTTLYVTLEPCAMCAGAMLHARIQRLVFGATYPKTGAAGGCFDLLTDERHNHRIEIEHGCLALECGEILKNFFKSRRQ